jgi:hypothetical protein
MTSTTQTRDDLFTHIHKALRLGLFDLTVRAGRTDWSQPSEVGDLGARWRPLLALLRAHSEHEDDHILRILDKHDPHSTEAAADQHKDLEDLLENLAERFDAIERDGETAAGLALYRDLARFIAAYLPHLHDEETRIMDRIWACCSDEEIAATRQRFMATITPSIQATTLEYMLPAIDSASRRELIVAIAGTAPPPVLDLVLATAQRVLPPADHADLAALVARAG